MAAGDVAVFSFAWRWFGLWIASLHRAKKQAGKPITDLGVTMPLNQSGGGPAPADAYEVYSALYQAPMQEPLAFAEDSVTDIPQVNGSCLRAGDSRRNKRWPLPSSAANQQSHRWEQKLLHRPGLPPATAERSRPGADVPGHTPA